LVNESQETEDLEALVREVIDDLPRQFTLKDMLAKRKVLEREYPENQNIDAKVRQTLQILRDQSVLRFLGRGNYERIDGVGRFSPRIDMSLSAGYSSRSQIARVVVETWAELNLYCVNCSTDELTRLPAGTPVADFICATCSEMYQVKAKDGRFGDRVPGAAYGNTLDALRKRTMPDHVLIEFDSRLKTVVFVDVIAGELIDEHRVIPRKPLSATARRAGWQGCTINFSDLPRTSIVAPAGLDRACVRLAWKEGIGRHDR
jgi:hypothetical protein